MKFSDFKRKDWIKQWAGNWSILTFSYWGGIYNRKPFTDKISRYVTKTVIVWRNGKSYAYQPSLEQKKFGKLMQKIIEKNSQYPYELCEKLKKYTDNFLEMVKKMKGKDISFEQYLDVQKALADYYYLHIQVKVGVDYVKPELINKYLPIFEKLRLYVEPVLNELEDFMRALAKIHRKKTGYQASLILATLKDEFHDYFKGKSLPAKKELGLRNKAAILFFQDGRIKIYTGKDVIRAEKIVAGKKTEKEIKGMIAHSGKIRGRVRLVFDPKKEKKFKNGEILVTGMTRPDYLFLMKKAAAIVTDGGGILCHAAIVARELKKPCIIGTKIATQVLKDGDKVEVDAEKGVVRKLK